MSQQTINLLLAYWLITTIIAVCWLVKNPEIPDDKEYFTLFDVTAHIFPSVLLGWIFVPVVILMSIKFKSGRLKTK